MEDRQQDFPATAHLNKYARHNEGGPFTVLADRLYQVASIVQQHRAFKNYANGTMLVLSADQTSASVRFSIQHNLLLGRPSSNAKEELIDLSIFDGYRYGVSRKHAMLWLSSDNYLLIEDLGSTNGTFIDGQRLKPLQRYLLNHNDRLQLGELFLRLAFEPSSVEANSS